MSREGSPLQEARNWLNRPGIVVVGENYARPTSIWDEYLRVFVIPEVPAPSLRGMDRFYQDLRALGFKAPVPKGELVRQEGSRLIFPVITFEAPKRKLLVLGFPDRESAQLVLDYRIALTEKGGAQAMADYKDAGKPIPEEHSYQLPSRIGSRNPLAGLAKFLPF